MRTTVCAFFFITHDAQLFTAAGDINYNNFCNDQKNKINITISIVFLLHASHLSRIFYVCDKKKLKLTLLI